jgi:hypothetical protein
MPRVCVAVNKALHGSDGRGGAYKKSNHCWNSPTSFAPVDCVRLICTSIGSLAIVVVAVAVLDAIHQLPMPFWIDAGSSVTVLHPAIVHYE